MPEDNATETNPIEDGLGHIKKAVAAVDRAADAFARAETEDSAEDEAAMRVQSIQLQRRALDISESLYATGDEPTETD